jgi:hypothetical protein
VDGPQHLVELADVAEAEAPQKRARGLRRGDRKPTQLLLRVVRARHREIVEAGRAHGDGLGDPEDELRLRQPAGATFQSQGGGDRRA